MKVTAIVVLFARLLQARLYCYTELNSISKANVPTRTFTTTISIRTTTVATQSTLTDRPSTVITLIGKTTITIPTRSNFTPIISAPRSTTTDPSYYPSKVICSLTKTLRASNLKTVTSTRFHYVVNQTTLTSTIATSTVYEACAPYKPSTAPSQQISGENVVARYRGKSITYWDPQGDAIGPDTFEAQTVALDAQTCCEWTQKNNYTGFSFLPYTASKLQNTRYCTAARGKYFFTTFGFGGQASGAIPGMRYGNGPGRVGGVYLEFVP